VSHLTFDGKRYFNLGGNRKVAAKDFGTTYDRYEIEVLDGASHLAISER
jgi:hypothetical protein